nr:microtubule-associated protein futsch-like isoform X6 [Oncorhynchus nerka]
MKKIFNFTKKKKGFSPNTSDTGSVLSVGYDLKEKDLGKVHKAAYGGDLAKLKHLAKKNDINQLDKENRTALHIACANGHTDVVQFLVESKAKLNLCDNQNRSPLMKAVQCQQERCVATLLEHDAEPNLVDINGNTALHLASCIPAFSTAMLLLEHEANVNAQNKEGYSPLTMAVKENHAEMAEFLLKEGADVNTKDQGHRSPLMIAACNGQISMVRLLLQYDADITLKDNNGWSSDDYAVMNGHHACSHLIIEHGTKRKSMPSPAHAPAKKKRASMLCSPSEEAGFSLGGPATDKDDVEDNSQTESISRVSKSAADDSWPSSDEEDELDITQKKHPKLNLKNLMNASKKGKNDECDGTELEETQGSELLSEQPSGSQARGRDSPEESPEGDNEDDDDEEEDEDDDEDDEDYEEEDDDDNDDEEEDEDDEDDYEEEQEGEEEEECDVAATSVKAEGIGAEEVPKTSSAEAVDIVDEDDQTIPGIKVSDTVVADSEHVDTAGEMGAPKNVFNAEHQANERMVPEILFGTSNYGIPATLDVEEDCVVSAIRVESRFSDEEDSLGYELNGTSDHKFVPEPGFPAVPKTPPHSTGVLPSQRNLDYSDDEDEEGIGDEDAPADYWSDEAKLIADDEDIREALDHTSTLGEPKNTSTVSHGETHRPSSSDNSFDSKDDDDIAKPKVDKCKSSWYSHSDENDEDNGPSSTKDDYDELNEDCVQSKVDKCKSSWDSTSDENDKVDGASTTREDEIIDEIPHLEEEDLISDFQLEPSTSPVQSISPKCISLKPKVDEPKSFWNSSSDDNVKKGASHIRDGCLEVHVSVEAGKLSPSLSVASPRIRAEDQQCSDDSWEDEDVVDEVEEMPNDDTSPAESPEPGEKKADIKESFDDDLPGTGEQVEDKNMYDDDGSDDDYYVNRDVAATGSPEPEEAIAPNQHKTDENSPRKWTSPPWSPRREIKDMDNLERGPSTPRDLLSLISRPPSANEQRLTSRDLLSPISRPTSKVSRPAITNERKLTSRDSRSPISRPESADEQKLKPRDSRSPISRSTSALSRPTTANEMLSKGADELDLSQPQKDVESVPVSMIDDWQDEKEMALSCPLSCAMSDKDKERSEDPDSQYQKLQYAFASGTIKVPDEGNDSEEILGEEDIESIGENYDVKSGRLPVTPIKHSLETRKMFGNTSSEDEAASDLDSEDDPTPDAMNAAHTPIEDIDEISDGQGGLDQETIDQNDPGETHEDKPEKDDVELQSTHSNDRTYVAAVQQHESDMSDGFSDQEEELPQTDIDDVDVDSPFEDEPEYIERATLEVRDNEDPVKGINLSIKWEKDSTEDEEDYDEDRGGDEEDEEEKSFKEEMGKTKYQTEDEKDDSLVDDSPVPGSQDTSKEKQRDFLSELGLEKGDDEEDSWDTESGSVSPRKHHGRDSAKVPHVSIISGENKEVLRNYDNDADNVPEKPEKIKRETLSILTKLELSKKDADKKTDIMEELGLGDVDDLEEAKKNLADASDWDTASTASRRTLPGHGVPSPGGEELREEASSRSPVPLPAVQEQEPDALIAERSGPEEKRHFLSERPLPLASPRSLTPQTQPQPCARKMLLQRTESEEDFNWDSNHVNTSTPSPVRTGKQLPNVTETVEVLKPNNPLHEPSPVKQESESSPEPKEQAQEEKDVASELDVGEDKTKANMEVLQKSSASRVAGGSMSRRCERELDKEEEEKPETSLGHPKVSRSGNGATDSEHQLRATDRITQRHWFKSPKRALEDQIHQQQKKEEGRAVSNEATLQCPFLGGARHGRAPQAANHVNAGDPLSVFDDSTLSEVSDDDGRALSAWHQKDKTAGEIEMAEDFDELTQSSDTATSDLEDPTSGYRHASFLIKQLDSATLDSVSIVKLQNMFHEYERTIQRERGRHGHLSDKVSQLEVEKRELMASLEESRDSKQALDHRQLELDTDLNNFKFQLKQEQEKHRNASMLYDKNREMLRRKEEELRAEAEEKHKVELAMRNLELEMRAILNNMKQSEEDRSETQRLLTQERGARALSETLLNNHLRKQQQIEEENRRTISKSNEALSQLTEATDRERELLQQSSVLQDELSSLRAELERSCSHSRQEESRHSEESEALRERLEDARRDLKLNEEALAQTVYQYTSQVTAVKAELAVASTRLEHERQVREQLEAEGESARTRLTGALQEAERCQVARADAERALHREREGHQRAQDKLTGEAANKREAVGGLSQKLAKAESRANGLENEVHRVTMSLAEMEHVVATLQRDKEQIGGRVKELEATLQTEREQAGRVCARQETLQERLAAAQSEAMLLRQQLEEAQNKGMAKEKAVTDAQERFGDLLAKLRSDGEERVQLVEERSKELATKAADLRDQVYKLEEEKNDRETSLRQLQQELADSLKKLSMSEASLEVNTRYRNDLEEEKARLLKDMDRLKGKLEESEDQYVQAERRIKALKSSLDEKEREVVTASQKLQEVLSAFAGSDTTIKQLEEAVQRLEIENARLEAAAKQQTNKIEALQKGVQDSAMPSDSAAGGGVRNRLEDLVTGLQCSKMTLEDQLSQEVQKQSMLSHNAQDSHALWEEELKSRSKLGLRLAELEKEKGELSSQMELEKKKAKKIGEQKKSVDTRLDQEMKRNTELQKEMYRLRTLVKTAKKKLREQDGAGAEFGSPMSSMRGEMGHRQTEADISRMKDKVDDLSVQLEKEVSRCSQLERVNGELKEKLTSLKSLGRSNERLERSKRHLEEELLGLRRQVEAGLMDQTLVDQYRRDAEERARQEIRQKLEEVNLFLQTQAASQEALEQIKAANEASLRSTLEQRIRELEGELGRAHSTQHDSMSLRDSTRTELDRYRELYTEELHLRKALAVKLERLLSRSNERLAEANTKLMSERHRSKSLIASSIVNGSLGGPLDMGSLGSVGAYGATLGPLNRSLGGPLLSPLGDGGQSSRVEAYLAKMQNELERNISKELDHATAELECSARMSPVGSASGSPTSLGWGLSVVEDPVSRATQQYLEVLKKNYMI